MGTGDCAPTRIPTAAKWSGGILDVHSTTERPTAHHYSWLTVHDIAIDPDPSGKAGMIGVNVTSRANC
jgi:hypothetical protein